RRRARSLREGDRARPQLRARLPQPRCAERPLPRRPAPLAGAVRALHGAHARGRRRRRQVDRRSEEPERTAMKKRYAITLSLCACTASAQDRADIDRTQIIGNRELPKVLYIVPWKKPLPGDLAGRPMASVLDEALAPIDRDVFRRQVSYDAQIRTQGGAGPSQ